MGAMKQGFLLCLLALAVTSSEFSKNELEELETTLEFLEFEFEDQCIKKTENLYNVYKGDTNDLSMLIENEENFAQQHRNELELKAKYKDFNWNSKIYKRLLDIMFTPGPMILKADAYKDYLKFGASTILAKIRPDNVNSLTVSQVQKILGTEKNATVLSDIWSKWIAHVQNSSDDLIDQISLLPLEAEANGAETVESYWLSVSEITTLDYKGAESLWNNVIPLYNNLRQFIVNHIVRQFGQNVMPDARNIPIHTLGSLDSGDWVTAAESLGALKESTTYNHLYNALKTKSAKAIYQAADDITGELGLKQLHPDFEKNSQFEGENNNCIHYTEEKCKQDHNPKTWNCKTDGVSIKAFLNAHEEVAHIKQMSQIEKADIGYLRKLGPRDSVLYEAISTATALLSLQPESLKRRGLISTIDQDANITSLLLTALYIIPPMPLHLSYDVWRLNVLKALDPEEDDDSPTTPTSVTETEDITYDTCLDDTCTINSTETANITTDSGFEYTRANLTKEWWSVRERIQGVGSPAGSIYEDYLLDERVVWNKPHLSKLLGPILLFQVLEHFKGGNTTENLDRLIQLLRKGKVEPWETIVEDAFNITELNTTPLINYFKPLATFLETGSKFKSSSYSGSELNFFLKESSLSHDKKVVNTASEDSNALLIVIAGLAVIGSIAAIISVIRKRMQKKRSDKLRRRIRHTAL